jgi:hypothetical protein
MAENTPNTPTGAVPPKPAEAAKVQPKKETVRINLPPKPTASPTIKIPAPSAIAAATPAQAAPAAGVQASAPSAASAAPRSAAPSASRSAPMGRAVSSGGGVGTADKALAIVSMVLAIAAVVRVFLLTGSV